MVLQRLQHCCSERKTYFTLSTYLLGSLHTVRAFVSVAASVVCSLSVYLFLVRSRKLREIGLGAKFRRIYS